MLRPVCKVGLFTVHGSIIFFKNYLTMFKRFYLPKHMSYTNPWSWRCLFNLVGAKGSELSSLHGSWAQMNVRYRVSQAGVDSSSTRTGFYLYLWRVELLPRNSETVDGKIGVKANVGFKMVWANLTTMKGSRVCL